MKNHLFEYFLLKGVLARFRFIDLDAQSGFIERQPVDLFGLQLVSGRHRSAMGRRPPCLPGSENLAWQGRSAARPRWRPGHWGYAVQSPSNRFLPSQQFGGLPAGRRNGRGPAAKRGRLAVRIRGETPTVWPSRSPVAMGARTLRRTSSSASVCSGGTGSSQKKGWNSSTARIYSMAWPVVVRPWKSIMMSTESFPRPRAACPSGWRNGVPPAVP